MKMMNEMLNRIANAIVDTPNASDYSELVARNVVKAMREPTEQMKGEGAKASHIHLGADESIGYEGATDVWQSMIDEILK